ncbi:WD40-repeat-containing domain protein [Sphaerosporella brunnea]|uniref:WD40-repeat-containing domain protein n=1 Tax=Sphaerosporella brunnea TaxID=1250544 RepID=A0A5J5EKW0_9PEZI|nr:WD40-repeat-containing domain protein [Sphaerosporella brunnea]
MAAQIPGFYYDTEKRKYFRLLPHHAAPTSSFYSASTVEAAAREKQRAEELREETSARQKRKRHAPLKSDAYVRATLFRELGHGAKEEDRRLIYAAGLRGQNVFETEPGRKITALAADSAGQAVVVGTSAGDVRVMPIEEDEEGVLKVNHARVMPLVHSHSAVTSISLSPERHLLATFMGERHPPTIYLTSLANPSSVGIEHQIHSHNRAIWTSSSSPNSECFVLGTSTSAIHLVPHQHVIQHTEYRMKSDVFATCFLPSSSAPTFLAGSRDGDIRLYDVRTSSQARPDITLRHGSTVTHIRALSEVGVIVNGLQRVANYDIRFPHPRSPSSGFAQATRAMRVYDKATRDKEFMIGRGFDVDMERGIMAVADHEHWVNLFSVDTGEKLRSVLGASRWSVPCLGLWFDEGRTWAAEGRELRCFRY